MTNVEISKTTSGTKTYDEYLAEYQAESIDVLENSYGNKRIENQCNDIDYKEWAKIDADKLKQFWNRVKV